MAMHKAIFIYLSCIDKNHSINITKYNNVILLRGKKELNYLS